MQAIQTTHPSKSTIKFNHTFLSHSLLHPSTVRCRQSEHFPLYSLGVIALEIEMTIGREKSVIWHRTCNNGHSLTQAGAIWPSDNIRFHGVPEKGNANTDDFISGVTRDMDVGMKLNVIRISHRLPKGWAMREMHHVRRTWREIRSNEKRTARHRTISERVRQWIPYTHGESNDDSSAPLHLLPLSCDRGRHTFEKG